MLTYVKVNVISESLTLVEILLSKYILFCHITVLSTPETFVSHANSRTNGVALSTATFYEFYGLSDGIIKCKGCYLPGNMEVYAIKTILFCLLSDKGRYL